MKGVSKLQLTRWALPTRARPNLEALCQAVAQAVTLARYFSAKTH